MKKLTLSIVCAVAGAALALTAQATDLMQSDDFCLTNNVLIPGTNTVLSPVTAVAGFGQTNLIAANYSFIGGRYGGVPFYNPNEQPFEVFEIVGFFTSYTNATQALLNGLGTTNPYSAVNNIVMDLNPIDDQLGGGNVAQGGTNYSVVFTGLDTTNVQSLFAYVPSVNFSNICREGAFDFRCNSSNNFVVERIRKIGWVQKNP